MDTKEAIKFMTLGLQYTESIDEKATINKIIELLQRGEKFEKILRDIKIEIRVANPNSNINGILETIDIIIEKYFPK